MQNLFWGKNREKEIKKNTQFLMIKQTNNKQQHTYTHTPFVCVAVRRWRKRRRKIKQLSIQNLDKKKEIESNEKKRKKRVEINENLKLIDCEKFAQFRFFFDSLFVLTEIASMWFFVSHFIK